MAGGQLVGSLSKKKQKKNTISGWLHEEKAIKLLGRIMNALRSNFISNELKKNLSNLSEVEFLFKLNFNSENG